jgi:hypothetical protein
MIIWFPDIKQNTKMRNEMGISKKVYETIIDVMGKEDYNTYKNISMNLAKYYPHIFMEMLDNDISCLVRKGEKIKAIKKVREERGLSLKEAKKIVDSIEECTKG